ncbi:NADH-quinone oxidoreductase subunit 5 family protein [Nitrososphaera viennensis]|nr:NADH-quinone oxidoreductase subunit L [Nitrososphaera viennensis]UVS70284.1 NADH-quinone oxidoreductase subunit L [Nitrososphaera viennensis]
MVVETTSFADSINVWLIWILPFAGAAIMPAIAKGSKKARDYIAVGFALASAVSAATLIPVALAGHEVHSQITWVSALGLKAGVLADPLAIAMTNIVAWIAFLIFVYSLGYMHGDRDLTRYWFFMLFFIGSMQLIVISDNLLMVFFGWEGVGLASYALIGFWYHDKKKDYVGKEGHMAGGIPMWTAPTHAGMKAFLMTKAGDVMMLAGMFLIFAYAGTFGFKELVADQSWAAAMSQQNLLVPAAVLLFGGAVGKSAQFPLNEWLLEAMTGPTSVSALIHAATMVKAGVFLVARLGPLFFALSALNTGQFFEVVAWTGAITAFLLATQALVSPEIKKVLAYSTGSQIGYMMMALGIAGISLNFTDGYTAGFFHLMSHAMFKASLFMGAGALLHSVGSRFMTDMGGLRKDMRKTYLFMMLAALSLAGAPLFTSGFWSKDAIFASILESGYAYSWPLFAMAVIVAVMTAFYTMRMIGMSFFGSKSKHLEEMEHKGHHVHEVGPVMWAPFAILAVATIAVGVIGFMFEEQLHHLLSEYLLESFGIAPEHEATGRVFLNLNPTAAIASVGAFAVGAGLGYVFYIARKADPEAIGRNIITRGIWKFLYNRWYLNTALYWGGVIGPLAIYRFIWRYFESTVIDGINPAFQGAMAGMSKVVKSGQTGITQTYLFVFAVGIMIVVMLLLM